MNEQPIKKIANEQLEDLVALSAIVQKSVPIMTSNRLTSRDKGKLIRAREAYRRLAYDFAGDLAQELLDLRSQIESLTALLSRPLLAPRPLESLSDDAQEIRKDLQEVTDAWNQMVEAVVKKTDSLEA